MRALTAEKIATLDACFGTYPHTTPLKNGAITSDRIAFRFNEVEPINKAFLMMVRQEKFDVSEMAIATYLQAKAYGKPLTLLPATYWYKNTGRVSTSMIDPLPPKKSLPQSLAASKTRILTP